MSKNITKEESESLKQAFSLYDRDGDGAITVKEFGDILKSLNVNGSAQEIDSIVKSVDSNQDGSIDFNEFVMAMTRHLPPPSKNSDQHPKRAQTYPPINKKRLSVHEDDELKQCFHAFDKNGDGFISLDELEEVMSKLGEQLSKQELKDMLEDADTNRDGLIDYKEFRKLMPKGL
ncbi:putative calmodulin [Zychaea mexicana]|uniref:putative calmodulin n=1 Tax=Zychaea mexicana TaxID=64656 RepID=UPI0022FE726F|nr:putative calmodulin [Zychaea mexicana]KAI9493588.1 putative calmodulin [Zychaea mexicana]